MPAYAYRYRKEGIVKAPAEITGSICQSIIDAEGAVTPERLVEVSKPKDAPLHQEFEWNNTIAAQKYREEQARQIIKNIVAIELTEDEEEPKEVQCWVNSVRAFVPTDERLHKYVSINTALKEPSWRNNLLENAKRDMKAFIAKYNKLTELDDIIDDMNNFLSA
jgi:uncharacterized protein YpuA (DUF1002 family)